MPRLGTLKRPGAIAQSLALYASLACILACAHAATDSKLSSENAALEVNLSEAPTTITTARHYWRASQNPELRDREYQLDLTFTVLFYDPDWKILYIQEGGNGDYLPTMGEGFNFRHGDLVRVIGPVRPTQPLSSDLLTVELLRSGYLPKPLPLFDHWERYADFHNTYVTAEGYVDNISLQDERRVRYDLICSGRRVELTVLLEPDETIPVLQNNIVRANGTFSVNPSQGGRPETLSLWSNGSSDITILADASAGLFGLDATSIDQLAEVEEGKRVKVEAYVFAQEPGQSLILVNDEGQLNLSIAQTSPLHRDDFVEVIGTPTRQGMDWTLKDPIYRLKPNSTIQNDPAASSGSGQRRYLLAQQVRHLKPEELEAGREAALSGVVTYYDPSDKSLYIQDASAGILVRIDAPLYRIPVPGEGIIVRGRVAQGEFSPCLLADDIELKGSLSTPDPIALSYEQALTGHHDSQWVTVNGYVESVSQTAEATRLRLATNYGDYQVHIPNHEGPLETALGSLVQMQGVLSVKADANKKLESLELKVPNKNFVQSSLDLQEEPFSIPLSTISSLERFRPPEAANTKVRIRGVVSYHDPGDVVYIVDGDDTLRVLSRQQDELMPGTLVDVIGLIQREGRRVHLSNPVFDIVGQEQEPQPISIEEADSPLDPALDGHIVSFTGRLLEFERSSFRQKVRLIIQNGPMIVEAVGDWQRTPAELLKGSLVTVAGVYDLQLNRHGEPDHMRILLRGNDDIAVLSRPSWLTAEKLFAIAVAASVALLAVGLWSTLLRRRLKSQTLQIKEQLEREAFIETKHREIIENVSDFIFTVDAHGRFQSCNKAGEHITGYPTEAFEGMSIYDLFDPQLADDPRKALMSMNLSEQGVLETQIRRKDGSLLWVEISAGFRVEGDAPYGYGVMRDVESRKRAELELKRARDAAETTTKAKNAFLATMSHELRTPMNGVIGMTELLLSLDLDKHAREYAETIRDSADSLLALLNDLLDLSKAEAGKLTIDPHPFNLVECITQPITLLEANANAKGLALKLERPAELCENVIGDSGRLRQVLLNLVGNAIKFTERGSVTLSLSPLEETQEEVCLKFEVTDTGIGISKAVQPRLFEPFEQADASLSRKFGGTGLGLNISRSIVSLMGGEIGLVSNEGEGSTFWFSVRLPKASARSEQPNPQSSSPSPAPEWSGGPMSILVVEDNQVNQKVTRLQLKKMGLETEVANDGFQAVSAVKDKKYDVIFMDCQMPGMDGLEATREIRRHPENDGIYIVALTASAMQGDRENCLAAGMDDYVTKPTRPDKLQGALDRFAKRNDAAPA